MIVNDLEGITLLDDKLDHLPILKVMLDIAIMRKLRKPTYD